MKIAHISDTHICLPEPDNSHRLADLQMAIDEICQMDPAPHMVVHTGDIAHNGSALEYRIAREIMSALPMRLQVIVGNKDKRREMAVEFGDALGDSGECDFFQYSIDTADHHLIFLDTLDIGKRLGTLCEQRLENFTQMLAEDKQKPVTVFMHHPPFDIVEAPQPFQFDNRQTVERFEKIVLTNPQIANIYCGHAHRYGESTIGNTRVNAISAIAVDLRWGDYGEAMKDRPVFEVYDL